MLYYLMEFEGIIGAVFGVVATLITTEFLRRTGRRSIYVRGSKVEFLNRTNPNGIVKDIPTEKFDEVSLFSYDVSLAVYNSSDIYFSLFNIKLQFCFADGTSFIHKPYDENKTRKNTVTYSHEEFSTIDFEPKKLNIVNMTGWIHKEELQKLTNNTNLTKVYLLATKQNNKKFKRKILAGRSKMNFT